jgi:hypothetical protein
VQSLTRKELIFKIGEVMESIDLPNLPADELADLAAHIFLRSGKDKSLMAVYAKDSGMFDVIGMDIDNPKCPQCDGALTDNHCNCEARGQ